MDDTHNKLPQNRRTPYKRKGGKEAEKGGIILHYHKQHAVQKRDINTFTKMRTNFQHKGSLGGSTQRHLRQSSWSVSSHQKGTSGGILLAKSTKGSYRICKDMSTMPEVCQLSHRLAGKAHQRDLTLAICKVGTRSSRTLSPGIGTSQIPHSRGRLLHKMDQGITSS